MKYIDNGSDEFDPVKTLNRMILVEGEMAVFKKLWDVFYPDAPAMFLSDGEVSCSWEKK